MFKQIISAPFQLSYVEALIGFPDSYFNETFVDELHSQVNSDKYQASISFRSILQQHVHFIKLVSQRRRLYD